MVTTLWLKQPNCSAELDNRASRLLHMHELEQNGLPCKNVNAQSIQQLTALKLQLRSCMLLHPSSQVSYLDSYNRIPVNATNCSIKFVP